MQVSLLDNDRYYTQDSVKWNICELDGYKVDFLLHLLVFST